MALTDTLRIETVSADKRHVEATMPIVPEVFQPHGYLHGGATIALRTGAVKQYWNVAAYDDAGDVVSDGVIMTKIVSLARLAQKEQERTS